MVGQYEHTIKVYQIEDESIVDSKGNFSKPTNADIQYYGRWEMKQDGAFVQAADGQQVKYSGIIYMPTDVDRITLGSVVEVYDAGYNPDDEETQVLLAKGSVKNFSKSHFNARIWL